MSAPNIAIIIHSLWGHVAELAFMAEEGAKAAGAKVSVFQVAESFSSDILGKMHADKSKTDGLPVLNANDLVNYDGFIFAFATRFGRAPAQVSALFDRTGGLWAKGALQGKFSAIITSTGSQHGGLETTALTTLPFFIHHGINFVPIGYKFAELNELNEVMGASPYNAATIAGGDNSRRPTEKELYVAKQQGTYFAGVVGQFIRGKQ